MNKNFRDIIIKHYQQPINFGFTNNINAKKQRYNSQFCVDDLTIEVVLEKEKIKSLKFEGVACTIATSAIDLFCIELESKSITEAKNIISDFEKMLLSEKLEINKKLNNLGFFGLVSNKSNRIRCAMIPAILLKKIL